MPPAERAEVRRLEKIGDLRLGQRTELAHGERAAGLGNAGVGKRPAVVRHVLHADAAWLRVRPDACRFPVREVDLVGTERRAEIVDERERPRARRLSFDDRRETDEPLVRRLVVPVREEARHQPQRVELRAARTLCRIDAIELPPGPSFGIAGSDLISGEPALDRNPVEIDEPIVGQSPHDRLSRAETVEHLRHLEREPRTTEAAHARQEKHLIRAEAERGQQMTRRDLRMHLRRCPAVLHLDDFAVGQHAIELRRGATWSVGQVPAANDRFG